MTTDFRALCAELVQAWDTARTPSDFMDTADYGVIAKIRAALAEPEPEGPTPQPADGEVAELVAWLRKTSSVAFLDGWPNEESINLARAANLLERLDRYDQALSAVMPSDFKDWWENSKDEWPDVAAGVIENLRKREELAWEQLDRLSPPSLKKQALTVLDDASDRLDAAHENIIRRALESLPS